MQKIGVNHEGSINLAKKLVRLASDGGGFNAVKPQKVISAETLASKNSPAYWDLLEEPTKSQFELFKKFDLFNNDDYLELAKLLSCTKYRFSINSFRSRRLLISYLI